ncbi:hypothetical protein JKP88DRAFT_245025 [Tribonema minus]|uniref:Uncharacterized protein n=1 Tax=Tribonema minus TaxID=303371 RepID=A0A835YYV8_9STRA|nr:hypothetical protein JKP88DRAFT_245025 [Tribonema minus]
MQWAAATVDSLMTTEKERFVALGLVSGMRGAELRDPAYTVSHGGAGHFITSERAKGGQANHRAPLWCDFARFEKGLALLRCRSPHELNNMQRKLDLEKVPALQTIANLYRKHFGVAMTPHKIRQIYAAYCFHHEYGHLRLEFQAQYTNAIKAYLGHRSERSSSRYEFMKHSPTMAAGTFNWLPEGDNHVPADLIHQMKVISDALADMKVDVILKALANMKVIVEQHRS